MTSPTDLIVRKAVVVHAPRARAFEIFATQIGTWWPLEGKSLGSAKAETVIIEPRVGGRWFERGVDGSESDWGQVIAFEPPERLVLNWQVSARWDYDPSISTEVEVRFVAEGDDVTRVELEHRGLEAYGDDAGEMFAMVESPAGWPEILESFRASVAAAH